MTAPIVYADTRRPYDPWHRDETAPYMADADRRTVKQWPAPAGQLWLRVGSLPSDSRSL